MAFEKFILILCFSLHALIIPAQDDINDFLFCHFPGAHFFEKCDTNLFTKIFCEDLLEILGDDNVLVLSSNHKSGFLNVAWALWNGQDPKRRAGKDKRIRNAYDQIVHHANINNRHITFTSTSYGSVVAAQTAIHLLRRQDEDGINFPVNLVFGHSMLCKKSALFSELENYRLKGRIGLIVYDEVQVPGDNVTGMCGETRIQAFRQALRMVRIFGGTFQGQPSILNCDTIEGHIHRKNELSSGSARHYLSVIIVDKELGGPQTKAKAEKFLANVQNEN